MTRIDPQTRFYHGLGRLIFVHVLDASSRRERQSHSRSRARPRSRSRTAARRGRRHRPTADLRIPVGLPGHRGLIWLTLLVAVALSARRPGTVTAVGAASTVLGIALGSTVGDPRHLERTPFAASRARYGERAAAVAERFGHPDLASYLHSRRAAGLSWRTIADECGEPATWLRRRAGLA